MVNVSTNWSVSKQARISLKDALVQNSLTDRPKVQRVYGNYLIFVSFFLVLLLQIVVAFFICIVGHGHEKSL